MVVGDADGADTAIQTTLFEQGGSNTTVNEVKKRQRAAMGQSGETIWADVDNGPIHSVTPDLAPGSRAYFTAKDVAMAEAADYGLMMWDATSTGTLGNLIELLGRNELIDQCRRHRQRHRIQHDQALAQGLAGPRRAVEQPALLDRQPQLAQCFALLGELEDIAFRY